MRVLLRGRAGFAAGGAGSKLLPEHPVDEPAVPDPFWCPGFWQGHASEAVDKHARLAGRRQCPVCGALYSLSPNAPRVSEVCDSDGSTLVVREDDREEVVTERMKAYDRQTSPVLEYFRASGFDVWAVDGAGAGGPQ